MILRNDVEQLGFKGNPPELSMYRSRARGAQAAPPPLGSVEIRKTEASAEAAVDRQSTASSTSRRQGDDRSPSCTTGYGVQPFGIKDGPLPVIVVAALLARDDDVGSLRARVLHAGLGHRRTPNDCYGHPTGSRSGDAASTVCVRRSSPALPRTLRMSNEREPALLEVVRGLVRFVASLTPYARRTLKISERARNIREALVRAREPAQLVFDELPAACGCPPFRPESGRSPGARRRVSLGLSKRDSARCGKPTPS